MAEKSTKRSLVKDSENTSKRKKLKDDAGFSFKRVKNQDGSSSRDTSKKAHGQSITTKKTKSKADFEYEPIKASNLSSRGHSSSRTDQAISDSLVPLPVRDTPIIERNKDFRKEGRRSSLIQRGKRASSMSNQIALIAHPDLPSEEFYKFISATIPEPVRMKQLLVWTARQIIDQQKKKYPATHENAPSAAIARAIEEEVLKDIIENRVELSWYSRSQKDQQESERIVLKKSKHPQNVANLRKKRECLQKLAAMKAEIKEWKRLLEASPEKLFGVNKWNVEDREIDESIPKLPQIDTLTPLLENLEYNTDAMRHSTWKMRSLLQIADEESSTSLQRAAEELRDRRKRLKKTATTKAFSDSMMMQPVEESNSGDSACSAKESGMMDILRAIASGSQTM